MESPHPSDQALEAYRSGRLEGGSLEAVKRHLETCPECWRRAAAMSSASFLDWVGGARKGANASPTETPLPGTTNIVPTPPPVDALPPGLAAHRDYEVKKELGRGGMGVVYLAYNTLLGRDEVLKVMGRHIMERPGVLDRFHREIRAVAKLRHPNIVSAYSAFRLDDSIVFAMEYVEGLDLSKMVKAKGPLPVAHASMFVYQTALGLQHAHEQGLVHRDIKPGNLMLSPNKDRATIKILDFGLARATREDTVDSALTAEGQILGTPDFIAPEQITDAKSADIRADIYSLGGTLYYLLMGRPPFIAKSFHEICQAHIAGTAEPLNLVRPDVPVELAAVVARMMAKSLGRRYQTPAEVAEALTPFFKRGQAPVTSKRAVISEVGAVCDQTQPDADAGNIAVREGQAAETSVAVSQWESLVDCRDDGLVRDPAPAMAGTYRPYRKRWPIILATSLTGLAALGVVSFIASKDKTVNERRGSAQVDDPGQDVAPRVSRTKAFASPTLETDPIRATASKPPSVPDAVDAPERIAGRSPEPARGPRNVAEPSSVSVDKQPLPSMSNAPLVTDNSLKSATHPVYIDEFGREGSRWPEGDTHGYRAGTYFVSPGKPYAAWRSPREMVADGTMEVVGRLQSEESLTKESWGVTVSRSMGDARRGLVVKLNGNGELFLTPHPAKEADQFRKIDPTIGPISHPAIKPGQQSNRLLLMLKKRTLEIFVNSVRVFGPVNLDYELTPSHLLLAAVAGQKEFRAEFDRFEIRQFWDGTPRPSPTAYRSIPSATRPVYFDDFTDPKSGWGKTERAGYASGIYFLAPHDRGNTKRSPGGLRADSALEVVGRLKTAEKSSRGSWIVIVNHDIATGTRGFMVKLNTKGELFLLPSPWKSAKEFADVEPMIGPIVHPAIKPANQVNRLCLVIKKRHLEIFVNSERVCEPVPYEFDLTPSWFQLGAWDGPGDFRAEFDSVSIRGFVRP